jgi:magnesium chelatase family protein
MDKLGLSPRGFSRVLKVARTIADLDGVDKIRRKHLAEAITLRLPGMITD